MERSNITSSLYFGPVLYKCTFLEKNHSNKEIRWEVIEPCTLRLERVQALSDLWRKVKCLPNVSQAIRGQYFYVGITPNPGIFSLRKQPSLLPSHSSWLGMFCL